MDKPTCTRCDGPTTDHCPNLCNRGWVRCMRCRAFGPPGSPMHPPIIPIDLEPET